MANKTLMPAYEYSLNILKEMKKCYEIYNQKYRDKNFDMMLSNSEVINFEIMSYENMLNELGKSKTYQK